MNAEASDDYVPQISQLSDCGDAPNLGFDDFLNDGVNSCLTPAVNEQFNRSASQANRGVLNNGWAPSYSGQVSRMPNSNAFQSKQWGAGYAGPGSQVMPDAPRYPSAQHYAPPLREVPRPYQSALPCGQGVPGPHNAYGPGYPVRPMVHQQGAGNVYYGQQAPVQQEHYNQNIGRHPTPAPTGYPYGGPQHMYGPGSYYDANSGQQFSQQAPLYQQQQQRFMVPNMTDGGQVHGQYNNQYAPQLSGQNPYVPQSNVNQQYAHGGVNYAVPGAGTAVGSHMRMPVPPTADNRGYYGQPHFGGSGGATADVHQPQQQATPTPPPPSGTEQNSTKSKGKKRQSAAPKTPKKSKKKGSSADVNTSSDGDMGQHPALMPNAASMPAGGRGGPQSMMPLPGSGNADLDGHMRLLQQQIVQLRQQPPNANNSERLHALETELNNLKQYLTHQQQTSVLPPRGVTSSAAPATPPLREPVPMSQAHAYQVGYGAPGVGYQYPMAPGGMHGQTRVSAPPTPYYGASSYMQTQSMASASQQPSQLVAALQGKAKDPRQSQVTAQQAINPAFEQSQTNANRIRPGLSMPGPGREPYGKHLMPGQVAWHDSTEPISPADGAYGLRPVAGLNVDVVPNQFSTQQPYPSPVVISPSPATVIPKTDFQASTSVPSYTAQYNNPTALSQGAGSATNPLNSGPNPAGAPASMAVFVPHDSLKGGPAVQLNIQPNAQQPTTLITLFQLPPGQANWNGSGFSSQALNSSGGNGDVPPEPTPPTYASQGQGMYPSVGSGYGVYNAGGPQPLEEKPKKKRIRKKKEVGSDGAATLNRSDASEVSLSFDNSDECVPKPKPVRVRNRKKKSDPPKPKSSLESIMQSVDSVASKQSSESVAITSEADTTIEESSTADEGTEIERKPTPLSLIEADANKEVSPIPLLGEPTTSDAVDAGLDVLVAPPTPAAIVKSEVACVDTVSPLQQEAPESANLYALHFQAGIEPVSPATEIEACDEKHASSVVSSDAHCEYVADSVVEAVPDFDSGATTAIVHSETNDTTPIAVKASRSKERRTSVKSRFGGHSRRKPKKTPKKFTPRKRRSKTAADESEESAGDDDVSAELTEEIVPSSDFETRRSGRSVKRQKYVEDWGLSDDEDVDKKRQRKDPAGALFFIENPSEDDSQIVDKILAARTRELKNEETGEMEEVDEFFVKYRNFSYMHCQWKTEEDLEQGDRRVVQKIRRFRQKRDQISNYFDHLDDEEPFNPDYLQVDRILDVSVDVPLPSPAKETEDEAKLVKADVSAEDQPADAASDTCKSEPPSAADQTASDIESAPIIAEDIKKHSPEPSVDNVDVKPPKGTVTHFLVKWCSLPYEECTWELEENVDRNKIQEFYTRRNTPIETREVSRPPASQWEKIPPRVYKDGNVLRDYQQEGVNWLLYCWCNRQNCILADEMGLGKTIQTITFLKEVADRGIRGPFLVVAPLSTIQNWQREFEAWTSLNAIIYHGSFASRRMIQEYDMYYKSADGQRMPGVYKFNALITTFELILHDYEELQAISWRLAVIDEAHRLKNKNCKLLAGLATFKIEHRILLTGTPLQNNVTELFSLLNFLEPRQFPSSESFLSEFGTLQTDDQVQKLQAILKPMMLRRLKEDVEKSLAPKEETIIEVELTNIQKKYYRAILERNFAFLARGANIPSLMNTMMELRKCCNHPFLITGAEDSILADYRLTHRALNEAEILAQAIVQSSGKLVLIDKLLPRLKATGHKVLIFSQMVRCLDILEEYLVNRRYPYERIDGNVRGDLRQAAIDRFSRPDSDRFVFLLCTRAGGLGINLTAADTVIIFDSDWNPQNDLQAQARCHRIGQEREVKVYRLITRNSYEREMFDKASLKLGLDKAILQSMWHNKEPMNPQLSKKDIEELLRKGAYGAIMDETNEGDKFCEEDIDQILQRRTQTITIQPGVKGSTFAKASFACSDNRSDIDINDPNFWAKWARKAGAEVDKRPDHDLIMYQPRSRKRRFEENMYQISEESAGESDSGDSDAPKKRGRNRRKRECEGGLEEIETGASGMELTYSRADYFRVEKFLSMYGWARWAEIKTNADLDCPELHIEMMCRTILLQCLRNYQGDEKVREFIWELITPVAEGTETKDLSQHLDGLYAPVPRGRSKGSKQNKPSFTDKLHQGWAALPEYNPPILVIDSLFQRHMLRHANKVLLRVRLLYYLKTEVIGDLAESIVADTPVSELDLNIPWQPEIPTPWWDIDADKSLLVGIFKHGYENVAAMRSDPALCFLERFGPPPQTVEGAAGEPATPMDTGAEDETDVGDDSQLENGTCAATAKRSKKAVPTVDEMASETEEKAAVSNACGTDEPKQEETTATAEQSEVVDDAAVDVTATASCYPPFPTVAELNARFRKLITLCQKCSKNAKVQREQKAKKIARIEQIQQVMQQREQRRLEERQRWSRREESDYYRTLVSFGVVGGFDGQPFDWTRFKQLARLEAKYDSTLTDYYHSYMAMCKRVCRKSLTKEEEGAVWIPDTLTEERASKVLQRVELMKRVRDALKHEKCAERIRLARRAPDFPSWWEPGTHDLELLHGVTKHGLSKCEENVVHDPEFSFLGIWKGMQKAVEASRGTRSVSRAKLVEGGEVAGEGSVDGDGAPQQPSQECTEESTTVAADDGVDAATRKRHADAELTISQIIAQQTSAGGQMRWPKERMLIYRLQNLCYLVEHGEWPSLRTLTAAFPAVSGTDADNRSNTPETPPNATPALSDDSMDIPSPVTSAMAEIIRPSYHGGRLTAGAGKRRGTKKAQQGTHPMQELIEAEKERVRAFALLHQSHQSFLHELERFPVTRGGGAGDEALNLSTKPSKGKEFAKSSSSAKVTGSAVPDWSNPLPFHDLLTMATLSPDTHVPVINLKDGTRLVGDDAPTLRNLAQWLNDHPHYIIDMPAPGMVAAPEAEIEPGEIVRPTHRDRTSTSANESRSDGGTDHVAVINRKTGNRISGSKAPTVKTIATWLEKNPDYDLDAKCTHFAKAKAMLSETMQATRVAGSQSQKTVQSKTSASAASTATLPDAFAAAAAAGAFGGLSDFDAMQQLPFMFSFNPMLMNMAAAGFAFPTAFPGGSLPPEAFAALMSPDTSATPVTSTSGTAKSPTSAISAKETKKSKEEKKQQQAAKEAAANAAAAAAATNPFLFPSAATPGSIFGFNPFLGMLPGMTGGAGFSPSMAAMTQLQALMGLQGLENMLASPMLPGGGAGASASSSQVASMMSHLNAVQDEMLAAQQTSTPSASEKANTCSSTKVPSSSSGGTAGVHMSIAEKVKEKDRGKKSGRASGGKLNALVSKLVENAVTSSGSGSKPGTPEVPVVERSTRKRAPPSKVAAVVSEDDVAEEEV